MRDLAQVLDAVLAAIPETERTEKLRSIIQRIRSNAVESAPEAQGANWADANDMLVGNGNDDEPWFRRVIEVWSGRHHEPSGTTFRAMQSLSNPSEWVIETGQPWTCAVRFSGPEAELRAREYAAWKNLQAAGV